MTRASPPQTVSFDDEFRRDDLEFFPSGDGTELIHSPQLQRARLAPVDVSALLQRCDAFRTIGEHARRFCEQNDLNASDAAPLVACLQELAQEGFLISRRQLMERCARVGDPNDAPAQIAAIAFPTRNRAAALRRGVESFLDNTQRHGRKVELVVADGSDDPTTRENCRSMLEELKRRKGGEISHAGLEEKKRFAHALVAESGCDPQAVEFALFNPLNCPRSTGANHNAIALHLAGGAYVSVDDDVVCRIAAAPDMRTKGVAFFSASDPTAHWFYPDLEFAVNAAPPLDVDFVGLHEPLLGRDLAACVAQFCEQDTSDTEKMGDDFLRRLNRGRGKVLATFAGHYGDPGVGSTTAYLWTTGETFARLTADDRQFEEGMTRRAVMRCAQRHSIGGANLTMNMCAGFDRRGLMPPFMPVQRAQDDLMGSILWRLFPDCYFAHLPFCVAHLPEASRASSLDGKWWRAGGTYTAEILAWCCQSFETHLAASDRAGRLQALGRHLMEMGSLSVKDFEEFVRRQSFAKGSARLAYLEYRLAESGGGSEAWRRMLGDYVESLRDRLTQEDCSIAADLVRHFGRETARSLMPQLTRKFGHLLTQWQALESASARLGEKGIRMATPVCG